LFLSRFGAFLGEGSSKTRLKNVEITNPTLVLFWPLTYPPTTGVADFCFFGGPPKIDGPPRTFAKSQTHLPTIQLFFLIFFKSVFGRFLASMARGVYKNIFAKRPRRQLFPKKTTKISMSVFPRFFYFIAFSGVSQRWKLKKTTTNVLQKNRVERFLQKIRPKIQTDLFSIFFGVSRRGDFKNTTKNIEK
jgi:hypothetical protein